MNDEELTYEQLMEVGANLFPPIREDGVGITANEFVKKVGGIGEVKAKEKLREMGLVPVLMRKAAGAGRTGHVWLKPADAEPYTEWIVKE